MGEITGQATEFLTYFMDLMAVTPSTHPNTVRLMNIASMIALYTCLYWKGYYKRMRPSQLLPALMPPISVPGHASFPSGHATQSWLVALCMQQALLGFSLNAGTHLPDSPGAGTLCAALTPGLTELAMRIARNREIAGLHYPTDSVGGRTLASKLFSTMLFDDSTSAPVGSYRDALLAARTELTP
jgi:membrane-associated phospholipid phosphatase